MKKRKLLILSIFLIFSILLLGSCKTDSSKKLVQQETVQEMIEVSLSVDCINAYNADNETAKIISDQGIILEEEVFLLAENSTVKDLLFTSGLTIKSIKGTLGTYISSIESLSEFAVDGKGGWVYFVNGEMPNYSIDKYILETGDYVEIRYTIKRGDVQ
ncbi:MAG TPA: DUF4430 domain-containing protein [Candidatus Eisenbacteria bacterium]|nr:DUF4430 domain-containing protein [Candidatus Eisenbacteria bacterium]